MHGTMMLTFHLAMITITAKTQACMYVYILNSQVISFPQFQYLHIEIVFETYQHGSAVIDAFHWSIRTRNDK